MSLEEIQQLKEKIGLKLFNQTSGLGPTNYKARKEAMLAKKEAFKRENKNRPREMSSKKQVPRLRDVVGLTAEINEKTKTKRDPRFDSLSGEFDAQVCPEICLYFTEQDLRTCHNFLSSFSERVTSLSMKSRRGSAGTWKRDWRTRRIRRRLRR